MQNGGQQQNFTNNRSTQPSYLNRTIDGVYRQRPNQYIDTKNTSNDQNPKKNNIEINFSEQKIYGGAPHHIDVANAQSSKIYNNLDSAQTSARGTDSQQKTLQPANQTINTNEQTQNITLFQKAQPIYKTKKAETPFQSVDGFKLGSNNAQISNSYKNKIQDTNINHEDSQYKVDIPQTTAPNPTIYSSNTLHKNTAADTTETQLNNKHSQNSLENTQLDSRTYQENLYIPVKTNNNIIQIINTIILLGILIFSVLIYFNTK